MRTMSGGPCLHYDCSNRSSFGYCKTTVCINEHYQQEQWSSTSNRSENVVVKPKTNADRIRAMTDEELAEYLFDRGNGCEYCYGICAFQDECDENDHAQEFCLEQIGRWLKQEVDDG